MAITTHLATPQLTEDAQTTNSWGYPATADVEVVKGPNHERHRIAYAGVPGTSFTQAPIASELHDTLTGKTHKKTGAAGTDTWEIVTSS